MGGKNPYIEEVKFTPATKKYKVTFVRGEKRVEVEVDPEKIPLGHDGLPGSILTSPRAFAWGSTTRAVVFAPAPPAM